MTTDILKTSPTRMRAAPAKGVDSGTDETIEREGGEHGAGLIRGIAVVTRGEAIGHSMWLDKHFVGQVAAGINKQPAGLKVRFTHPGLSSDGLGKFLGRIKNGRMDGDIARGDLHFTPSAHDTPDGDLATYIMDLAESDPQAFATSIVFEHDRGEEDRFIATNKDEDGNFTSPDEDNPKNYTHARLKRLWADDIVDEPAANPGGLFHRGQEIPQEADALLSYSLGLTSQRPELVSLEIDPDRVSGFVSRFLSQHGLEVVRKKEVRMNEPTTAPENKPADVNLDKERLNALRQKYGADPGFVLEMWDAGKSMQEAETEHLRRENAKQAERLAAIEKECETLKAAKSAAKSAGVQPVEFGGETAEAGDFMAQAKALAASKNIRIDQAMSRLAREKPDLHAAFVEQSRNK